MRCEEYYTEWDYSADKADQFFNKRTWGPKPNYPNVLAYKRPTGFISPMVIAGPCQIESPEQVERIATELRTMGIKYMRGGVFSAGTYPGAKFGLDTERLEYFTEIAERKGMLPVIEVFDPRDVALIAAHASVIQIGARAMQNYALLNEVSKLDKWVTLKRAPGATLDEFLGAAEYLAKGKAKPILVERGGNSHHTHVRYELSVSTIAAIKKMTDMPVLVDASHGSGRRDIVPALALAGIAAGADGCIVECHYDPDKAKGADYIQTIDLETMKSLTKKISVIHREAK
jgi:3-deoxy-7-phosphoheptulonate synthase